MTHAVTSASRLFVRDLVALTKPRIISLLLVTMIAPMLVAGTPNWELVVIVFIGGYLMAGGANAVNMYLDRDIDDRMARTRLRPIPSGRLASPEVLVFGILLATSSAERRGRFLRSSAGRRSRGASISSQSILSHHFLLDTAALLGARASQAARLRSRRRPNGAACLGEREMIRQMLWYTGILLPLTILPVALGAFGALYLVAALLLGAALAYTVVEVARTRQWMPAAWSLYKFSLLYLALLFGAMVADRLLAR